MVRVLVTELSHMLRISSFTEACDAQRPPNFGTALQGIAATAEQLAQILQDQDHRAFNVDMLLLRAGIDYVGGQLTGLNHP